jgi:ATP-dependent Lhr-like helicase
MITYMEKGFSDKESLGVLNKDVREWFTKNFNELTIPQKFTFKLVSEHKNILVAAPTGSGKTMSGFVAILSDLFDKASKGELSEEVYCIYISPLRALNNDIYKNLAKPLEEIYQLSSKNEKSSHVTIAVRTGDTPQKDRQRQLAHPPNILVTTPESLAILITSEKFSENLKKVEYVVIDEIHELANNKRGVHLALSLERLRSMIGHDFTRIGLGATLYPLEEAAKYLVGCDEKGTPKDCVVIDASWSKKLEVQAISPVKDMIYASEEEVEEKTYSIINSIIKKSKSTLIFTNTRSGTERVVFNLKKKFGYNEEIAAHHGSLSRESRLEVEELLKSGSLKCAVSSTSLELGVDIGSIENVIQLGSPKSVTRAVQRIGRAGHKYKSTAKGEIIVLNRDDLVECSIMLDAALKRHLDSFRVPMNALDILAQHIVGMSIMKKWDVKEAYEVVRSAYPYSSLKYEDFMDTVKYLAGEYVGLESRRVYGKIWYDENEHTFGRRGKMIRPIYMLNLGAIPDEVSVNVFDSKTKKWIGNIEEEFLTRMKQGDIFTLGGRLYKFEYAKGMRCYVTLATSSSPTIPPWFSEQLPLSYELAMEIGKFRGSISSEISKHFKKSALKLKSKMPKKVKTLLSSLPIDSNASEAIYNYFVEQQLFAGVVPNDKLIIAEITVDPKSGQNLAIFHSLYGRRINDTLSRVLAIHIGRKLGEDVGIMINDNGFLINTESKLKPSDIEDAISAMVLHDPEPLLKANIRKTEIMKRRFRHVAARSFMILRNYKGYKLPVGKQQINATLLIKAVEEIDKNFPVLKETYREIFEEVMDLPRTKALLQSIKSGETKYRVIKTQVPSPFAHSMITFGHADVVMMKERHEYLKYLHKMVIKRINASK